jgi:tRNA nucleotidyltransferase (CCA-adding enzyme)
MALALTGPERGRVAAVPGALDDLAARQLRVLHARSFLDDPTRLLRLARYAARLDFSVEPETLALAQAALASGALATVSGVRIGNELRKLASEADPVRAFVALRELGIDSAVDPALGLLDDAVAARALRLLEPDDRRDRVVLAAALLGATREAASALLERLGFVAEDREVIAGAVADADRVSRRLEYAGPPSAIDWAAGGAAGVAETVALAGAIHPANAAREWLVELRHKRLSITGADLVAAGIAPGPAVGAGLAAARAALMDDEATDAASQLAVALQAAG